MNVPDFLPEQERGFWCALHKESGGLFGSITKDADKRCLNIFGSSPDIEECLVSWGFDPDEWVYISCETTAQIFLVIRYASGAFSHLTFSAPLTENKEVKVFDIDDVIEYVLRGV